MKYLTILLILISCTDPRVKRDPKGCFKIHGEVGKFKYIKKLKVLGIGAGAELFKRIGTDEEVRALPGRAMKTKCDVKNNSKKPFTGVDLSGKTRACLPMKETMCTMSFTAEDQFAADCKAKGNTAIQCGCHDWICIKK